MNLNNDPSSLLNRIIFRPVQPTDIPRCCQLEAASYPPDEAASKSQLQYRQHHAAPFFRCAFLIDDSPGGQRPFQSPLTPDRPPSFTGSGFSASVSYRGRPAHVQSTLRGTIIGFICSTRCSSLTAEAMSSHDATGKLLAIHSVVVEEPYRNRGVASAMIQDYALAMERLNERKGALKVKMDKIVLIAKKEMLAFYVRNGFCATGLSSIVHGKDQWFDLERSLAQQKTGKECFIVDAFADLDREGTGNSAAVVILPSCPKEDGTGESATDDDDDSSLDDIEQGNLASQVPPVPQQGIQWMATVAKEFNLAETAFLWPFPHQMVKSKQAADDDPPCYVIRYFTRTGVEVDLCGHATLASASVLLRATTKPIGDKPSTTHPKILFCAKKDVLSAELAPPAFPNHSPLTPPPTPFPPLRIAMDFPWKNVTPLSSKEDTNAILNMLSRAFFFSRDPALLRGEESLATCFRDFFTRKESDASSSNSLPHLFSRHIVQIGTTDDNEDLFLELTVEGFDALHGIKVNYEALTEWQGYSRGIILCCLAGGSSSGATIHSENGSRQSNPRIDFRSRFFGPKVGIDEDPVTGSAHCSLGPYFGDKLNKTVVVGRQESERGGLVECILKQNEGRVGIVGMAVTTVSGTLWMGGR